jgi:amidase
MKDIAPSCTNLDLTNMHIGIPWRLKDLETLHLDKRESFRCVLATLKQAGATLIHDVQITGAEEYEVLPASHKQILLDTDMKHAIDSYLSSLTTNPQNIHDIGELIAFTKACPEEDFPQRNVAGFERAQATSSNERLYCDMMVRDTYFTGPGGIEAALDRHRCDILLIPTLSVTMQTFAAKAGSPVMSVPMGSYARGTVVEEDTKNGLVDIAPGIP